MGRDPVTASLVAALDATVPQPRRPVGAAPDGRPMREKKIQVLIVDDSALVRQVIAAAIGHEPDIAVLATASDPLFAIDKMSKLWPDVIVLDIEMPRMDGLAFLRKLMSERPTPVVICSSFTETGSHKLMQALSSGAVGIITKPKNGLKRFLEDASNDIVAAIRAAARANVRALVPSKGDHRPHPQALPAVQKQERRLDTSAVARARAIGESTDRVIAIGTSTGGTQALEAILTRLPVTVPGMVIVQHMPEHFTRMFAERLDSLCEIEVREARSQDRLLPGRALLAPGGKHMQLTRKGAQYQVEVADGPLVNRHKPSVDVLFRSVAKLAGKNAVGVLMTGMGDDGARGLKEMRDAGAATIAQDESTCVVFGMPREAIRLGAAGRVLSLDQIPAALMTFEPS